MDGWMDGRVSELIEKYLFALYVVSSPAFMGSVCHEATVFGKAGGEVYSWMLNTDILTESVSDELFKAFVAKARHCSYPDSDQCLTGRFYVICFDLFWVEGNLSLAPKRVFHSNISSDIVQGRRNPCNPSGNQFKDMHQNLTNIIFERAIPPPGIYTKEWIRDLGKCWCIQMSLAASLIIVTTFKLLKHPTWEIIK